MNITKFENKNTDLIHYYCHLDHLYFRGFWKVGLMGKLRD
jgi:hypothetical protein